MKKSGLKLSIKFKPAEKVAASAGDAPAEEGSPEEEAGESPEYAQHEIDDAMHHLTKAAEIKQDPHLMKALQPHLAKKVKAIKSLDDLRSVAKSKLGSDRMED